MTRSSMGALFGHRRGKGARRAGSNSTDLRLRQAVSFIETLERRMLLSASLNFAPATSVSIGSHSGEDAVVAADVNGDGIPDLVTLNGDGTVSVAIGNGNGTFQPAQYAADSLAVGANNSSAAENQSMVVADINGTDEIIVSRPNSTGVCILQLDQNGVLQASTTQAITSASRFINAISVVEINGDDFLVTANNDGSVSKAEFKNPASAGAYFYATKNYYSVVAGATHLESIATGNFVAGGDGADLVVVGNNHKAELIPGELINGVSGGFDIAGKVLITQAGTNAFSAVPANLTSSSYTDLLIVNVYSGTTESTVTPLLGGHNTPGGSNSNAFSAQTTIDPGISYGPAQIAVANEDLSGQTNGGSDFNGDGKQDFVFTQYLNDMGADYQSKIFLGNGDGTFTTPGSAAPVYDSKYTATADFNGDGLADDAGSYNSDYTVQVALNQTAVAAKFTSATSATVDVGIPFNFTIDTSGFPSAAITEAGSLPKGLQFVDNGNGTATISGIATTNKSGTFTLQLSAKNSSGAAATQTLTLHIAQPAIITSSSTATFTLGIAGSFLVKTSGGLPSTTFSATGLPAGLTLTDNTNGTATISGTPTASGAFTDANGDPVVITATSGPFVVSQDLNLTVNAPPVITGGATVTFTTGIPGSFTIDANNESVNQATPVPSVKLSGKLPSGMKFKANSNGTGTITGTPSAGSAGVYHLTVNAHNSAGSAAPELFVITVDKVPVITSSAQTTFVAGQVNTFTVKTSGNPSSNLSEFGALPTGVSFVDNDNGTATLSGIPVAGTGGVWHFTITATNTTGNNTTAGGATTTPNTVTQNFTLIVDETPSFTSSDTASFTAESAGTFIVTTSGFPNAVITSSALPSGLTFKNNGNGTATISGTAASSTVGTHSITLTATDSAGSVVQTLLLTVLTPI